jgi:hypothetical protein
MGRERAAGHAITRQEEEIIGGYGAPAGGAVESLPIGTSRSFLEASRRAITATSPLSGPERKRSITTKTTHCSYPTYNDGCRSHDA